ncbi:MAG: hypothetical protein EOM24_09365 [Chloroflexia bacterium]|nr:hypothetical protein [Chloroflexia bacterium]
MNLPSTLKLSRFCHIFQKESYIALFHTLKVQTLFFEIGEGDKIVEAIINREPFLTYNLEKEQEGWVGQLLAYGMLVGDDSGDIALLEEVREDYTGYPDISIL